VLYLFQARGVSRAGIPFLILEIGEDLGLVGNNAEEWEAYQKACFMRGFSYKTKMMSFYGREVIAREVFLLKTLYLALAKTFGQILLEVGEDIFGNGILSQRSNSSYGYHWRIEFSLGIIFKGRDGRGQISVFYVLMKQNQCTISLFLVAFVGRFGVIFTQLLIFRLFGKELFSVPALRVGLRRKQPSLLSLLLFVGTYGWRGTRSFLKDPKHRSTLW
jgi:hypothetical protein